jgi:hypothetical protein
MLGASLALVFVVLGGSPSADPAELVEKLGASRFAERESAEAALAALGRLALPSLKAARNSKDLEIQTRATGLITRIEGSLLIQPTTVALDFQDVPIERLIQAINQQSGLSLILNPEDQAAVKNRQLTLKSASPLPFWKAIDAICEAGQLHFIPGAQVPLGHKDGTFLLYDGPANQNEPVSDFGPFRVHLTTAPHPAEMQLSQRRDQPFNGRQRFLVVGGELKPVAGPDTSRQFFLNLLVSSEPRLSISQNGMAKVTVAVDDKGQSLLVPSSPGTFQHMAGYNGLNPAPTVRLRIDLARPEAVGQKIRLVRGTIPVVVATRRSDPLEVPIAGSADKVFRNDDVALTVLANRPAGLNGTGSVDLAVTQLGQVPPPIQLGEGEPLGYRPDTPLQQIEILDAQGNPLPWFPSGTFYNGEQTRLSLTIVSRGKPAVPATIRYHGMIRASVEVPFEFRNLPMP